jgi:hypothetical protein
MNTSLLSFQDSSDKVEGMKKSFMRITFLFASVIILFCFKSQASAGQSGLPFKIGEKMTFEVRWSYILAGEATLEILPAKKINGMDSCHILLNVRTSDFVDIFYKVRDSIESYVNLGMDHSLMYLRTHRAKTGTDSRVDFDWEKRQARYSLAGSDDKFEPVTIPQGAFDPLSVFYAFRLHDLGEVKKISIPVTDGKKVIYGNAQVIKREVIEAGGTSYDTYLVEPELDEISGVIEKSRNARLQIWVTADRRHIPVRISSKVAVGSFIAELTSYSEGSEAILEKEIN